MGIRGDSVRPLRRIVQAQELSTDDEVRLSRQQIPELGPEDRLWVVTKRSEHFAEAHWVVLRPVAGRGLVRRMTMGWST